jgi:hypothetical protein
MAPAGFLFAFLRFQNAPWQGPQTLRPGAVRQRRRMPPLALSCGSTSFLDIEAHLDKETLSF